MNPDLIYRAASVLDTPIPGPHHPFTGTLADALDTLVSYAHGTAQDHGDAAQTTLTGQLRHSDPDRLAEICVAALLRLAGQKNDTPTEVRAEYAADCHDDDDVDIVMSSAAVVNRIYSRVDAVRWAQAQIGKYNITRYTITRRDHHIYPPGARFASATTEWVTDYADGRHEWNLAPEGGVQQCVYCHLPRSAYLQAPDGSVCPRPDRTTAPAAGDAS